MSNKIYRKELAALRLFLGLGMVGLMIGLLGNSSGGSIGASVFFLILAVVAPVVLVVLHNQRK